MRRKIRHHATTRACWRGEVCRSLTRAPCADMKPALDDPSPSCSLPSSLCGRSHSRHSHFLVFPVSLLFSKRKRQRCNKHSASQHASRNTHRATRIAQHASRNTHRATRIAAQHASRRNTHRGAKGLVGARESDRGGGAKKTTKAGARRSERKRPRRGRKESDRGGGAVARENEAGAQRK